MKYEVWPEKAPIEICTFVLTRFIRTAIYHTLRNLGLFQQVSVAYSI